MRSRRESEESFKGGRNFRRTVYYHGRELPAAILVDSISRQIQGVLGKEDLWKRKEECPDFPFIPSRKFLNIGEKI